MNRAVYLIIHSKPKKVYIMGKRWNDAERRLIIDNTEKSDKELAVLLSQRLFRSVTPDAVRRQRRNMGIKKSPGRRKRNVEQ